MQRVFSIFINKAVQLLWKRFLSPSPFLVHCPYPILSIPKQASQCFPNSIMSFH